MPDPSPKRILVVDDDHQMQSLVERLLSDAGYAVEVATGGLAAIARLTLDADWHAIVTDKDMPGADGFEVARRAHEVSPALPVIMMTAHAERLSPQAAQELDAYVAKPFRSPQELVEAVKRGCEVRTAKVQREQAQRTLEGLRNQLTPKKS